ncbi:MAG TPA: heavy metal-binding domain-containing protein [Polyangiaceae bacterium]|jgi:hypothetical protein|nr:MAG: hypothetical protein BWY17_00456 [Deltaproteobacteria bacterium ADurb.Bin207]HNS96081.1 heavy metal-binding domain-containing protein [Polyangiaceae bacterium]HNZ20915.1 heavy metal-binding domain-containing protein [Polyangiaceae bacterium]HOD21488.1 heavy metal-binding domain-containing protein [Polyangiaceae bacterium]HOE47596.1 heavy metal-binding domain-containing protein [Polyangiaceae bacterium]
MRVSTFPLRIRAVRGLLLAAALGTSACGVHQAGIRTGVNPAERLPPVDPAVVQFFGGDDPGPQGQEIGYVISLCDADEKDLALSRLRDAAAKLGADAIVGLRIEIHESTNVVASGRAVRSTSMAQRLAPGSSTTPTISTPAIPTVAPTSPSEEATP